MRVSQSHDPAEFLHGPPRQRHGHYDEMPHAAVTEGVPLPLDGESGSSTFDDPSATLFPWRDGFTRDWRPPGGRRVVVALAGPPKVDYPCPILAEEWEPARMDNPEP